MESSGNGLTIQNVPICVVVKFKITQENLTVQLQQMVAQIVLVPE